MALPSFYRQLIEYEKSGLLSFPAYAELLLQDLDEDNLKEAESAIAAMEESLAEEERKVQEAQDRERKRVERKNRIISLLNEVGKLMAQRQFQEAEQRLEELLQEDPGNPGGLFYMAQVSARTGDLQRAFVYYERVSGSSAPGVDPRPVPGPHGPHPGLPGVHDRGPEALSAGSGPGGRSEGGPERSCRTDRSPGVRKDRRSEGRGRPRGASLLLSFREFADFLCHNDRCPAS